MSARDTLAAAHERMTPEQVAEHALVLAAYVEAQGRLLARCASYVETLGKHVETVESCLLVQQTGIRRVHSLITGHHKAAGRDLLARLAADPMIERTGATSIEVELPPASLFDPREG